MTTPDDQTAALLARARDGDGDARDALLHEVQRELADMVPGRMGPRARRWAEPEDIVLKVLAEVAAWLVADDAPVSALQLRTGMRRRVDWRIMDLVEKRRRDLGESAVPAGRTDPAASGVDGAIDRRDHAARIERAIDTLPEPLREPFRLVRVQGLSYAEAGARLGISPEAVRKRVARAQTLLQDRLDGD